MEANNSLPNTIMEFDLNSGTQKIVSREELEPIEIDSNIFQPREGISHTYSGHIGELMAAAESYNSESMSDDIRPSYIFGPDDRVLVPDATVFPFSSVVSIHVEAANGSNYIGSGAIIDEFHVLTVAHVAYIADAGGWVSDMEIVPARDYSNQPFGAASADIIRLPGEWIASEDYRYDWALVTLDQPLGASTGWMGVATYDSSSSVYTGTLYTTGYPGDLNNGWRMYNTTDVGKRADEYNHWFALDTAGGQSGSAIWTKNATGEYIITILAYEYLGGVDWNFGTRINEELYNTLATYLMIDADPVPKPELRNIYADTTAGAWSTIYKKNTVLGILTDVENVGVIASETVKVNFYLSQDNNITIDDYLLGTETIATIGILQSVEMDWFGTVPKEVPNGQYYIGWIIDPDNTVPEYDEEDNSGTVGSIRILVSSTALQEFFWTPLGTGIIIGGVAVLVLIPTILIISSVKRRRKRNRMANEYPSYQDYTN